MKKYALLKNILNFECLPIYNSVRKIVVFPHFKQIN